MSTGDGRDGAIRSRVARGQLGGRLAGLSLPQQIWTIAMWPFMEQLLSFICTFSDLYIATHMGTDAAETLEIANGMGAIIFLLWLGFVMQGAVAMGATALVSRMTGARRFDEANLGACQAAVLGFGAGVLSALVMYFAASILVNNVLEMTVAAKGYAMSYISVVCFSCVCSGIVFALNAASRGSGDTRLPFIVMLIVDVLNIVLSIIFVFAPAPFGGWGLPGIAAGTVIAYATALCVQLWVLQRRKKAVFAGGEKTLSEVVERQEGLYVPPLYLDKSELKPNWGIQRRILKIGMPQAIEIFGVWLIQMYCLKVISNLPYEGALGAHNIAVRIESLSFLPGFAIGMSASALVGQYLGAGSPEMARQTIWKCVQYSCIFMTVMGLILGLFPEPFCAILAGNSPVLLEQGVPVMRTFMLAEPIFAACLVMKMSLRGAGDTRRVMLISYGVMGFFRVGVTWFWSTYFPESLTLTWVWLLFCCDMLVQVLIFQKIIRGKSWTKLKV